MSEWDKIKGSTNTSLSDLPQPPKCVVRGGEIALDNMPMCSRCLRDGGIVLFGRRHPPQRAALHPNHVSVDRDRRGNVSFTHHKGPEEPLCYHHVEFRAWELGGERVGYPMPVWARGKE